MSDVERSDATVSTYLLDDVRVSMKLLQQQHAAAWAEVDRIQEQLREAVDLLHEIGAMVGAKANGKDARTMAKRAREFVDGA